MAGRARASVAGPAVKTGAIRPLDLKDYDGPLYVSNTGTTIISVNLSQAKGDSFRIGPRGSIDGSMVLPKEVANNSGFQNIWRKGIVSVTTDSAMEDILMLVETQLNSQTKLPIEAEMMPSSSERDIVPGKGDFKDFVITEEDARNPRTRIKN